MNKVKLIPDGASVKMTYVRQNIGRITRSILDGRTIYLKKHGRIIAKISPFKEGK